MRKISVIAVLFSLLISIQNPLYSQKAFPEAEGAGAFAVGGRNGSVYHVSNLNKTGPGSLADAVSIGLKADFEIYPSVRSFEIRVEFCSSVKKNCHQLEEKVGQGIKYQAFSFVFKTLSGKVFYRGDKKSGH